MGFDVSQIPNTATVTNNTAVPVSLAGFTTIAASAVGTVVDLTKFSGSIGLGGISPRKAVWQALVESAQTTTIRPTGILTITATAPNVLPLGAAAYDDRAVVADPIVGIRDTLPGYAGPRVVSVARNANSYVLLTLDRPIYHIGRTALVAGDLAGAFSQNGDTATNIVIASVQTAAGGALAGGETVIRVNLTVTGASTAKATIKISFNDSAVADNGLPIDSSTFPTVTLV